jgi:presenilin-like A22 family membrane protease
MKHQPYVVIFLLSLFLLAQFIGLFVLDNYVDKEVTAATGVVTYRELPAGIERPDIAPNYSFVFISIAILIGTGILLLIMKFRSFNLWKLWYFLAVTLSLAIAWAAFIPQAVAGFAAFVAAVLKVFRPNFIIHNLTELFIYSGLAAIFVPIMNVFSASVLLLLISAYDMYAVWKSKHMISMAKFQTASNLFAGLAIPKSLPPVSKTTAAIKNKKISRIETTKKIMAEEKVAIIGGGDIGFPLLFAGVVMAQVGFQKSFIIPIFATLGLAVLFMLSRKGKFYPAMPFVTAGCFIGYGFLRLL